MGERVVTLEDLLRPGLRAVCVGINPSPTSVAAGHYYQGPLGKLFFRRLRGAGVLPVADGGFEDDAAFASGIGFTDIVKRPTPRAADLKPAEFEHGRDLLAAKLEECAPELVIFTYKKTAETLFGPFPANGFVDRRIGRSEAFVMPGPYESAETAGRTLRQLAARWSERGG